MRIKKTLMVLRLKFIVCALSFLATACLFPGRGVAAEQAAPAKLAVLVVFDQLRGDYLSRWDRLFGPDGFHRIEKEGVWFTNCHYPYAYTVTGAGHASLTTGTWPSEHGIIGNEWFDRATGDEAGCVAVGRYTRVPPKPGAEASRTSMTSLAKTSVSPERLLVPNVADALKDATGGKGKVVSLSFKDRSAVLPGGKRPDACYWFDTSAGIFVTSTYYREKPHAWVDAFNKSRIADKWFSMNWDRLRTDVDYESLSGPDDVIGEGRGQAQGRTFPHPMHGGDSKPGSRYNQALYNSPFGNELLCSLAAWAIDAENLGNGDAPDLLCVSFSCNDTIGHIWGPDSQEVLDVTLRSDLLLGKLLNLLDDRVGKGKYILAVTADHGVCPLPEVARSQGRNAKRVSLGLLSREADAFLNETFVTKDGNRERWLLGRPDMHLYLNQRLIKERGIEPAKIEEVLAGWLRRQPEVAEAYTRTQMAKGLAPDVPFRDFVQKSYYAERSGDVMYVLKPFHVASTMLGIGSNHGTPHDYDTHVPLLVLGAGVKNGSRSDPVTPLACASILAKGLGIKLPSHARAGVPAGMFVAP